VRLLRYDCQAMKDCYICGRPGADSRDHVIPESFFPSPRPNNLITLPAHYSCHNRLNEEYVRAILAGLADSPPAMRLNEGPAGRALRRNEPLKRDLRASMIRRIELRSPGGLILGHAPGVRLDTERFYPLMEKIARGLYTHHRAKVLPVGVRFNWAINEPLVGGMAEVFQATAGGTDFPGVLEYRYGVALDEKTVMTVWWLRFYGGTMFRCVTQHEP
jgi:hypothetical protein